MTHFLIALVLVAAGPDASAQPAKATAHCTAAAEFLREQQHMVAEITADTIDDWRSARRVAGCTVTAAGATSAGLASEARAVYERLRASGWTRTPEPRDFPNEGALRFRRDQSDCLFHVNAQAMLFTDAEDRVNDALRVPAGSTRYQVYVMCTPLLPASDR